MGDDQEDVIPEVYEGVVDKYADQALIDGQGADGRQSPAGQEPEALVEPRIIVRAAKCGHHFDEGCNACASAEKWANAQLDELRAQLAESQSEREEQARLLGMSGSREAKLGNYILDSR